MTEHLNEHEVSLYRTRSLTAQHMLRASNHLAKCEQCRARIASPIETYVSVQKIRLTLEAGLASSDHLTYQDQAAYTDGDLRETDVQRVRRHLKQCKQCAGEMRKIQSLKVRQRRLPRWFMWWPVPALALTMIASVVGIMLPSSPAAQLARLKFAKIAAVVRVMLSPSPTPLSGSKFAEFAASSHRQHAQGNLALDISSDSQEALNEWFKAKSPFSLALPASLPAPGEERPYRLEGARLLQVAGKTAVYIAYQMETGPVSLIVAPASVAVASGGVKVDFKKVSFHYRTLEGYKVVTWSLSGRTYALVSQEGNSTQQSCMICHSPMRDRDLSRTPTPLRTEPVLQ